MRRTGRTSQSNDVMRIKVCGMKYKDNIEQVAALQPDMLGFIFYEPSPRNVDRPELRKLEDAFPESIARVGVFVNEQTETVINTCKDFGFEYAQLHGGESPEYCRQLQGHGLKVIKVFHMHDAFALTSVEPFEGAADLFLFDTKTPAFGGSGQKFNWDLLNGYSYNTPYLLSGGISDDDATSILALNLPGMMGIDANSGLEESPGLKNVSKVESLINQLRK